MVNEESKQRESSGLGPWLKLILVSLVALSSLLIFLRYLDDRLESTIPPPSQEPPVIDVRLDDSYYYLTMGEVESALYELEELKRHCQSTGQEFPPEAEELYDFALQEWLVYSISDDDVED